MPSAVKHRGLVRANNRDQKLIILKSASDRSVPFWARKIENHFIADAPVSHGFIPGKETHASQYWWSQEDILMGSLVVALWSQGALYLAKLALRLDSCCFAPRQGHSCLHLETIKGSCWRRGWLLVISSGSSCASCHLIISKSHALTHSLSHSFIHSHVIPAGIVPHPHFTGRYWGMAWLAQARQWYRKEKDVPGMLSVSNIVFSLAQEAKWNSLT